MAAGRMLLCLAYHVADPRRTLYGMVRNQRALCMMRISIVVLTCLLTHWALAADVVVTDGDTLKLDGTVFRLDGIDAPEKDQVCVDEKGILWACGIEARDRLMEYIGKRPVQCEDKG